MQGSNATRRGHALECGAHSVTLSDVIGAMRAESFSEKDIDRVILALAKRPPSWASVRQAKCRAKRNEQICSKVASNAVTVTEQQLENAANLGATAAVTVTEFSPPKVSPMVSPKDNIKPPSFPLPTLPFENLALLGKKPKVVKIHAKPKTPMDPEYVPDDGNVRDAIARGLVNGQLEKEWRKFQDHHIAHGKLMADWDAAWRTWCSNVGPIQHHKGNGKW